MSLSKTTGQCHVCQVVKCVGQTIITSQIVPELTNPFLHISPGEAVAGVKAQEAFIDNGKRNR